MRICHSYLCFTHSEHLKQNVYNINFCRSAYNSWESYGIWKSCSKRCTDLHEFFFGMKMCILQRCYLQWNLQWNVVTQLGGEPEVTESYYHTSLQAPGMQGGVRNVICCDISIDSRFTEVDLRFKFKGNYSIKYHVLVSHAIFKDFFWKQK